MGTCCQKILDRHILWRHALPNIFDIKITLYDWHTAELLRVLWNLMTGTGSTDIEFLMDEIGSAVQQKIGLAVSNLTDI